jgi:hypothetical protein
VPAVELPPIEVLFVAAVAIPLLLYAIHLFRHGGVPASEEEPTTRARILPSGELVVGPDEPEDDVAPLGVNPAARAAFLARLPDCASFLATVPDGDGPAQMLQYEVDGGSVLPVFTSAAMASTYLRTLKTNQLVGFGLVGASPVQLIHDNFRLVVNARSEFETPLSKADEEFLLQRETSDA